ncbi:MAG TPA: 6-carboxytetrahydropterin synthase [Opitutales bacterium]|nr:6-carboxytetrahydropterin synthase [Opitutales bacterium]
MSLTEKNPIQSGAETVRSLKGQVLVTRRVQFCAAHRLNNPDKSDSWNIDQYGICNHQHWHGHNYILEVTVAGEPDPETGYTLDLGDLKKIIHEEIVDKCDHRNFNCDVDFMKGIIPTTENLVIAFWNQLEPRIKRGKLYSVRLQETENNSAEYRGGAGF